MSEIKPTKAKKSRVFLASATEEQQSLKMTMTDSSGTVIGRCLTTNDITQKDARIAELEAENARLRAALQPFAEAAILAKNAPADSFIESVSHDGKYITLFANPILYLRMHHLLVAAKALGNE